MVISYEWLKECYDWGKERNFSYMVAIQDTQDNTCLIDYVERDDSLNKTLNNYRNNQSFRIMNIFDYSKDFKSQLTAGQAKERIEKLPGFNGSFSVNKVRINFLNCIPFEQMGNLPDNMNGYIDQDGNFYPGVSISSTQCSYNRWQNISMEQFAEAFITAYVKDPKALQTYQKGIENLVDKREHEILRWADRFLIEYLGLAKFHRYIDTDEYGSTDELSCYPSNPTPHQLIMLQQLSSINYNGSTNIRQKDVEIAFRLAKVIKGQTV